jgi:hypothetical protein
MDEGLIRGAAEALSELLRSKLADPDRKTVELERDEAISALGLIEGVFDIFDLDSTNQDASRDRTGAPGQS